MYRLCKFHVDNTGNCSTFRPIFSTINIPTHKLAKFLAPVFKSLSSNDYFVKDLQFTFVEETVEQNS